MKDLGVRLRQLRLRHLEGGDAGVIVGFRDELLVVQRLSAVIVELLLFVVGFGAIKVENGGVQRRIGRCAVVARGGELGAHGGEVRGGLDVLKTGEELARLHVVTLFDVEVGDLAHGVGADVDVSLGLDLAGRRDNRSEVFLFDFAVLDSSETAVLMQGEIDDAAADNEHGQNDEDYLLHRLRSGSK